MAEFITGGPVPFSHPSYIKRTTQWGRTVEDELLQILQGKQDVTIVGPRQIGKSSMVGWLSSELRTRGFATAYIDMTRMMNDKLTEAEWVRGFCDRLIDSLSSELPRNFNEPAPSLALGLNTYFGRLIRFLKSKAIVICIDEANSVPESMLNPFYGNIRAIMNERRIDDKTDVDNVQFIFAGVFDPKELIRDQNSSPFNTTHLEVLIDFSQTDCRQLFDPIGVENKLDIPETVIEAVFHWTQGNPFITQLFASAINDTLKSNDLVLDANLVHRIMPTIEDSAASNLDYIRDETLRYIDNSSKREFLREILQGKQKKAFQRSVRITKLSLIGAIKRSPDNLIEIRNPMVAAILHDELLEDSNLGLVSTELVDIPPTRGDVSQEVHEVTDHPSVKPDRKRSWESTHRAEFYDIILDAYDKNGFKNMLYMRLNRELSNLTPDGDFPSMLIEVIKRAEKEGWIVELALASQRHNSSNLKLQEFITQNQFS